MSIRLTLLPALAAGLGVAGLVSVAAPAMAQAPAKPTPATAAAPAAETHRDAVVEHRIADLHSKLKITAAEQKPFEDFAQAMRDNAHRMDDAVNQKRSNAATATAVEQMKAYAELAQAHADEVSRLVTPFSTLYDSLSPEQKKLADQSFRDFSNNQRTRAARS